MKDERHIVIRALAGTGKTFQLSNRYLGLLNEGVQPDQILATTFTRKAAGEIQQRIMERLAEAALDNDARKRMGPFIGEPKLTRRRCFDLLTRLLRQLHRLRISTLDSFFSQLAGSYSLELGLPPGWTIIEPLHDSQLREESIAVILSGDSQQEVSRLMNLMAKGEAERNVSDLVRDAVGNLYGLFLETTAEAWARFPATRPLPGEEVESLLEELAASELPENKPMRKARQSNWEAAVAQDWEQFIGGGIAAKVVAGQTQFSRKNIPPRVLEIYQRLVAHAKAVLVDRLAKQTAATYELLQKFDTVYQQMKLNARALRFEDVTRALSQAADSREVARQHLRLDASISHLLLDEFQDTSLVQWRVLRPLAASIVDEAREQTSAASASLFCVGDVKQAIYSWRGGRSQIFDALEEELPGVSRDVLTTSFRSSQPVIDVVNRTMANLDRHPNLDQLEPAVRRWREEFPSHSTARGELPGYVEMATAPRNGKDEKQKDVTLHYVAGRVAELATERPAHSIGVLARKNSVVARFVFELRRLGVAASEEGGNPLTDSAGVQVISSLLQMSDHPGDTAARYHLANSPLGPQLGFVDARDEDSAVEMASAVRRSLLDDGYGPSIYRWSEQLAASCNRRDRNRLQQLVELAFAYQPISTLRPGDFLRYVADRRVADPTAANVRVMTIHQAKGLQFDIVVLPDLDEQLVRQNSACVVGQPGPAAPIDRVCLRRNTDIQALLPQELQSLFDETTREAATEALCTLYVAMTRAIHSLHMIIAPSSSREKNLHKTSAGLLRAALTDGQPLAPESCVFEAGDRNWRVDVGKTPPKETAGDQEEQQNLPPIRLAPATAASKQKLEYATPSGLEGGSRLRADRLLQLDSSLGMKVGSLIHAWFEQIDWLDEPTPDDARLLRVAERIDHAGLDVHQQLANFRRMLELRVIRDSLCRRFYEAAPQSMVARLLGDHTNDDVKKSDMKNSHMKNSGPVQLEVQNERRFAVQDDGRLLAGSIDRLVLIRRQGEIQAADVIDFKTDAVDSEDEAAVEEAVLFYRPQLEAYRLAVAKMFRLRPQRIAARLLFVSAGVVRNIFPANS